MALRFNLANVLAWITAIAIAAPSAEANDRLAIAIPYRPSIIDPLDTGDPVNRAILSNIGYALSASGPDDSFAPEIASTILQLNAGKTWRFILRPDLRFASGAHVHPEDVKRVLEIYRAKILNTEGAAKFAPALKASFNNIERIEVSRSFSTSGSSEGNLDIELIRPDPGLGRALSFLPIFDPEVFAISGEQFGSSTFFSGVGPFQIAETTTSKGYLLISNEKFYQPLLPRSKKLEFRVYPSAANALSGLRAGAVDVILLPTTSLIEKASLDPTLVVLPSPVNSLIEIDGNRGADSRSWSDLADPKDKLVRDRIIARRSLELSEEALARFDLRGSYLP